MLRLEKRNGIKIGILSESEINICSGDTVKPSCYVDASHSITMSQYAFFFNNGVLVSFELITEHLMLSIFSITFFNL